MWKVVITTTIVFFSYVFFGGCVFLCLDLVDQFGGKPAVSTKKDAHNFSEILPTLLKNNYSDKDVASVVAAWNPKSDGGNDTVPPQKPSWTYANAFYFAFHMCTTIGYGDISPNTAHGQMLTVLYALIGIPINILFFKLFGESFAESYQETIWRIKGDRDSPSKRTLADVGFFLPWTFVFIILPSVVFKFTEDWSIVEGIYYSFITLTTVGLGDYVAGGGVENITYFILYKLVILCWMIYGLAFTSMIVDYLAHLYQINLLFEFFCDCKKCKLSCRRTYVDIEKLDVHFRLLRSEHVKHKYSIWGVRQATVLSTNFQTQHMANLVILVERTQGELVKLLQECDYERENSDEKASLPLPKDAFPVKVRNVESNGEKQA